MPNRNAQIALVTKRNVSEVLQVGRVSVRVLDDGSLNAQALGMVQSTIPPRTFQTPPHVHTRHAISFLVTEGTLEFTIANGLYRASAGDYITVPIGAPYTFSNPFETRAVYCCIFAPGTFIGYYRDLAELTKLGPLQPEPMKKLMEKYGMQLVEGYSST